MTALSAQELLHTVRNITHPDGTRWIGYRAGTYLVDRAMRASGKSAADLVAMPTEDLLRLAQSPSP